MHRCVRRGGGWGVGEHVCVRILCCVSECVDERECECESVCVCVCVREGVCVVSVSEWEEGTRDRGTCVCESLCCVCVSVWMKTTDMSVSVCVCNWGTGEIWCYNEKLDTRNTTFIQCHVHYCGYCTHTQPTPCLEAPTILCNSHWPLRMIIIWCYDNKILFRLVGN